MSVANEFNKWAEHWLQEYNIFSADKVNPHVCLPDMSAEESASYALDQYVEYRIAELMEVFSNE